MHRALQKIPSNKAKNIGAPALCSLSQKINPYFCGTNGNWKIIKITR